MKIVIVGNGKVGQTLSGVLATEGHDIVVIDNDQQTFAYSDTDYDVIYVQGNGLNYKVQEQAGVDEADLLIAVTSFDEVNMLCCLVAKKLGCADTIARIRDPAFVDQLHFFKDELGVTQNVNPELYTATEITRILHNPSALKIESFAGGRIEMVELKIEEDSPIANKLVKDFRIHGLVNFVISTVERDGEFYIPKGDFRVLPGDKINVSVENTKLSTLFKGFNMHIAPVKNVLIVGGGKISYYLTKMLLNNHMDITIIEKNEERCKFLAGEFEKVNIIHADASEENTLASVNFEETDAFVALTNMDEENLVMSLYAGHNKCRKVITKVNRLSYLDAFAGTKIDTVISPKMLIAQEIIKMVRGIDASSKSEMLALYKISSLSEGDSSAEALEFEIKDDIKYLGVPLSEVPIKSDILLACILRKNKTIIPKGGDSMKKGDVVIIVTKDRIITEISEIFD